MSKGFTTVRTGAEPGAGRWTVRSLTRARTHGTRSRGGTA